MIGYPKLFGKEEGTASFVLVFTKSRSLLDKIPEVRNISIEQLKIK